MGLEGGCAWQGVVVENPETEAKKELVCFAWMSVVRKQGGARVSLGLGLWSESGLGLGLRLGRGSELASGVGLGIEVRMGFVLFCLDVDGARALET